MCAENTPFLTRSRKPTNYGPGQNAEGTGQRSPAAGIRFISTTHECKEPLGIFSPFGIRMVIPLGEVRHRDSGSCFLKLKT